jgi:hypothetical protein
MFLPRGNGGSPPFVKIGHVDEMFSTAIVAVILMRKRVIVRNAAVSNK